MNGEMLFYTTCFQAETEDRYRRRKATLDKPEGDKDWHVEVFEMIESDSDEKYCEIIQLRNIIK